MAEIAAAAYQTASTLTQGAVATAKGLTTSTTPVNATFRPLRGLPSLQRSSHSITCIGHRAYLFGGEVKSREPADNSMHVISLPSAPLQEADYHSVAATPESSGNDVPAARFGHAAAAIGSCVYIFGGRTATGMGALKESGRVWVFDTTTSKWSHLDPFPSTTHPPARSYHAMSSSEHPLPPKDPLEHDVLDQKTLDSPRQSIPGPPLKHSHGTLFIHGGCLSNGSRTADVWAFDVSSRAWAQLPSAPGPARGGTTLALVKDRLYRYGGFDGTKELGGAVDWLDLVSSTYDDKAGKGEMPLHPSQRGWQSDNFPVGSENNAGLANRAVTQMIPVSTGQGRNFLLILGGEVAPSAAGHAQAGNFTADVWTYQIRPEGLTTSALKDATREFVMGKPTGEAEVAEVRYYNEEGVIVQEGQKKPMAARGWFAASPAGDIGSNNMVVVWGGINEDNERLGDGWIIEVE